PAGKQFDQAYA
ncbi:hypothetical protein MK373_05990, partial [Streptococcus oralis]|nr:hypothetical protein [Streptococcus oralis]